MRFVRFVTFVAIALFIAGLAGTAWTQVLLLAVIAWRLAENARGVRR
jgi:hypothetical protein